MRIVFMILVSCVLPAALLLGAARGEHTWAVVAPPEVDARILRQLEALAAQDQALIRFFPSLGQAERYRLQPGNLVIELHEEPNINSFVNALKSEGGALPMDSRRELARQGYILVASYPRASVPNRLRITAAGAAGFHHALLRIPDLLMIWPSNLPSSLAPRPQAMRVERGGAEVVIADFPSYAVRGIVEGFYGVSWSHQDRVDILRFEGQHGTNVYYYAPKDDPYHRKLWRDPYPAGELKRLAELVEAAHANFVDFCFAISPGLTMTYLEPGRFPFPHPQARRVWASWVFPVTPSSWMTFPRTFKIRRIRHASRLWPRRTFTWLTSCTSTSNHNLRRTG